MKMSLLLAKMKALLLWMEQEKEDIHALISTHGHTFCVCFLDRVDATVQTTFLQDCFRSENLNDVNSVPLDFLNLKAMIKDRMFVSHVIPKIVADQLLKKTNTPSPKQNTPGGGGGEGNKAKVPLRTARGKETTAPPLIRHSCSPETWGHEPLAQVCQAAPTPPSSTTRKCVSSLTSSASVGKARSAFEFPPITLLLQGISKLSSTTGLARQNQMRITDIRRDSKGICCWSGLERKAGAGSGGHKDAYFIVI